MKSLNKKLVFISLADMSEVNGQGIYSRRILSNIAQEINYEDNRLYIITPQPNSSNILYDEFPPYIKWLYSSKKKSRNMFWHVKFQLFIFFKLLYIRPCHVLFSIKPSMIAVELARLIIGFDKIILVEGLGRNSLKSIGGKATVAVGELFYRVVFRKSKAIYPAYNSALEWVKSYNTNAHIETIPCGVDTRVFHPETLDLKYCEQGTITIGYVGSFRDVHRLDLLLNLAENESRVKLLLVGSGQKLKMIKKLVKVKRLDSRVQFVGPVCQQDVCKYIQQCQILWAFTDINHWGVPIKAFEYLACNKFIIASRRHEFNFVEEKGFGLILDSNEPHGMLSRFSTLINSSNFHQIISVESFSYIEKYHNWANFKKIAINW